MLVPNLGNNGSNYGGFTHLLQFPIGTKVKYYIKGINSCLDKYLDRSMHINCVWCTNFLHTCEFQVYMLAYIQVKRQLCLSMQA